jgi:hypothetical protein
VRCLQLFLRVFVLDILSQELLCLSLDGILNLILNYEFWHNSPSRFVLNDILGLALLLEGLLWIDVHVRLVGIDELLNGIHAQETSSLFLFLKVVLLRHLEGLYSSLCIYRLPPYVLFYVILDKISLDGTSPFFRNLVFAIDAVYLFFQILIL